MTPIYLKFPDEATATSVLCEQVPVAFNDEGEPTEFMPVPRYRNIDVIGPIYEPSDDPEAEPVPLEGWHVNILALDSEDTDPLAAYEVIPENPRRMWSLA